MSYKTQCGNAAFFWLRFHTIIKKYSDYQRVTFQPVAASRRRSCGNHGDACGGLVAIAETIAPENALFRVAVTLDLIPFATCKVRHEDRLAAILDGRS